MCKALTAPPHPINQDQKLCRGDALNPTDPPPPPHTPHPPPPAPNLLKQVDRKPYEEEIRELLFQNDPRCDVQ